MLGGGTSIVLPLPFCIKPDKLIAVENINLRIGCPPFNNKTLSRAQDPRANGA